MSGIEVAGIALAVVPLRLYILEHQEAELRPFKALYKYRKQYRRSAEDLGLCLVQLEDTISSVFRDAGISSDGADINALVQAYDSSVWNDNGQEAKLIAHFGKWKYEHGFEVKLRQVRDGIMKVSQCLGLEKLGTCKDDDVGGVLDAADSIVLTLTCRRFGQGFGRQGATGGAIRSNLRLTSRTFPQKSGKTRLAAYRSKSSWSVCRRTYNGWRQLQRARPNGPP